jgi:hypothetical protein
MAIIDYRPAVRRRSRGRTTSSFGINQERFAFLGQETPFFATHVMKVMADRLRTMDLRLVA